MNLFSNCVGKCHVCASMGNCLAGTNDDNFFPASKQRIKERFFKESYAPYRIELIEYLREQFHLSDTEILMLLCEK